MADDAGKMPEQFVHQPAPPLDVKVRDLVPEHGVGFLGVYDLAVDTDRRCWVRLDAPVFGADFEQVAPILIRRARDGGYEIRLSHLPDRSDFPLVPDPDATAWVRVEVV